MRSGMDRGAQGRQDENGLEEEYTFILIQMDKMGLASRRPWQEGGSQTSEQDRQRLLRLVLLSVLSV